MTKSEITKSQGGYSAIITDLNNEPVESLQEACDIAAQWADELVVVESDGIGGWLVAITPAMECELTESGWLNWTGSKGMIEIEWPL